MLIVFLPYLSHAQFTDDFSDGNFTQDPAWGGIPELFIVNDNYQLQLHDMAPGQAFLSTPIGFNGDHEWRFWCRLAFSPSANNNAGIYLFSNTPDLTNVTNGIFVQLGEVGSMDAVRLMSNVDGDTSTLIRGTPGNIATSFYCRVKVVYNSSRWHLYADYTGGDDFLPEGYAMGSFIADSGYIGVLCNYTISNSQNFYFDDFYAGPIQYDTIPPEALNVYVKSPMTIEIQFSERLEDESAMNPGNYILSHESGNPEVLQFTNQDKKSVELIFSDSLIYGEAMSLIVKNIRDHSGNMMEAVTLSLAYYTPLRYDVLLNEIMADPSPPQSLPEYEYLELYNTTHLPIDLSGWTITIGTAEKLISRLQIPPYGYIILGKNEADSYFTTYGTYYGFESFSLVNTGQDILLSNSNDEFIHGISYDDSWYRDEDKSAGGYSIELINPDNPCMIIDNWKASKDGSGGTPGRQNSVFDDLNLPPFVKSVCVFDSLRIKLVFSQSLHQDFTIKPAGFYIDGGIGDISAILPDDHLFTSFMLYPSTPLNRFRLYTMSTGMSVKNCLGEDIFFSEEIAFGIPENAVYQDLIINEILFNPYPGGTDYVEIYNRSENVISLSGLRLASVNINSLSPSDTNISELNLDCKMLLPGEYALLCKDIGGVARYYECGPEKSFVEMESFPSYSNDNGCALLMDEKNILDVFIYHKDMHYPLLNSAEGVSLERINSDRPASDVTNWHSASQLAGFGTPGYQNSQRSAMAYDKNRVWISPKVFTPGYDGINDHIGIYYDLDTPGCLANILIFNLSGQIVRHLINNEMLGSSGYFSWDGIRDDRQRASSGVYLALIELVDLKGEVFRYKETMVISP